MIVGQEFYRRSIGRTRIKYLVSHIKEIRDGIAYLANGKSFDATTGLECDTEESYIWEPLTEDSKAYIQRREQAGRARRWFRKILELDEVAIELHQRMNTDIDTRRYYHHLTPDERLDLEKQTVCYLKQNFKQPYWCGHQNALDGVFGCERIIQGWVVSPNKCFLCPSYINPRKYELFGRLRMLAMIPILKMNQYLQINDYEQIEMGNREPTEKELNMLLHLYNMNDWSMQECRYFLDTISAEKRKEDPMFKKWGDMVRFKVNSNSIFYENSKLKNWQYLQSEG